MTQEQTFQWDTSSGGFYGERVATDSRVQEEKLLSWKCIDGYGLNDTRYGL